MLLELIQRLSHTSYDVNIMIIVLVFMECQYCLLINDNILADI